MSQAIYIVRAPGPDTWLVEQDGDLAGSTTDPATASAYGSWFDAEMSGAYFYQDEPYEVYALMDGVLIGPVSEDARRNTQFP